MREVVVGLGETGPHFQGAAELVDGLRPPSQTLKRQAQVAQGLGKVWPQVERSPAAADRSVEPTKAAIHLGEVGMKKWGVGFQGHGPADQLQRPGVISLLMVQDAEQVQRHRIRLFPRQDSLIELSRRTELARLVHLDGGRQ